MNFKAIPFLALVLSLPLTGSIIACGSSDDGNDQPYSSGTSSSKQLDDITDEEAVRACQNLEGALEPLTGRDSFIELLCISTALNVTQSQDSCESWVTDCIDNPPDGVTDLANTLATDIDCSEASADDISCDATVGEFEACINDSIRTLETYLGKVNCSLAEKFEAGDELSDHVEEPDDPASCEALDAKCPDGPSWLDDEG